MRKSNPSEPVVSANAVPSARNARSKTSEQAPRARAAKHSKAVVEEPLTASPAVAIPVAEEPIAATPVTAAPNTVTADDIAGLAYSYWEARGYQDGNPEEDWTRAESELKSMSAGS